MYIDSTKIVVSLATAKFTKAGNGMTATVAEQGAFLDGYDVAGSRERRTSDLLDNIGRSLQA